MFNHQVLYLRYEAQTELNKSPIAALKGVTSFLFSAFLQIEVN